MKNKLKLVSKHKKLLLLTILSFFLMIVGFLHIPILKWCGVDVFALRGILVITAIPIVAIFALPISFCFNRWSRIFKNSKLDEEKQDNNKK